MPGKNVSQAVIQFHAARLGDHTCNIVCELKHGAVIIRGTQQRYSFASKAAYQTIGQNRFQAISNFNAVSPILNGQQDHHPPVCALVANAPFGEQIVGEHLNRLAIERMDRHYGNLRARLRVHLLAQAGNPRDRLSAQDVSEIIHIALGLEIGDFLGLREAWNRQKNGENQEKTGKPILRWD